MTGTECGTMYFGNVNTKWCEKCEFGCETCTDADTCTLCLSQYILRNVNLINLCICPNDETLLDNGNCFTEPVVDPCDGKPYFFSSNASCTDACGIGLYLDGLICRECHLSCAECSANTVCTSCTNGYT